MKGRLSQTLMKMWFSGDRYGFGFIVASEVKKQNCREFSRKPECNKSRFADWYVAKNVENYSVVSCSIKERFRWRTWNQYEQYEVKLKCGTAEHGNNTITLKFRKVLRQRSISTLPHISFSWVSMNTSHKRFLPSVFSPQGKPRQQAAFCSATAKKTTGLERGRGNNYKKSRTGSCALIPLLIIVWTYEKITPRTLLNMRVHGVSTRPVFKYLHPRQKIGQVYAASSSRPSFFVSSLGLGEDLNPFSHTGELFVLRVFVVRKKW